MRYRLRTLLQFRLASLMLCVTVVCIVCGLAANYPAQMIYCVMHALPFAPTAALWFLFVSWSRKRITVAAFSAVGICVSLAIFQSINFATAKPAIIRIPGQPQLYFDLIELGLMATAAAIGVTLFGGSLVTDELLRDAVATQSK